MKRAAIVLAILIIALLEIVSISPACASDNPLDLLKKSEAAEQNISYRGLKFADINIGRRVIRAHFKIVHKKPNCTRTEYFRPSELAGIVVIEKNEDYWRFLPSQGHWQHNKWELAPQRINLALRNYKVTQAGRDVVAGRQAHVIKLTPRKRGNPSETVWIDTVYHLVLKNELKNSSGTTISVSAFRQIIFEPGNITDAAFAVPKNVRTPHNPVTDLGFTVVKPKYMPKGYSFVQTTSVPVGNDVYAAHLMYTNGINTISVFERKAGGKNSGDWKSGFGSIANMVHFSHGQVTFTIIGDIAKRELQRIADSLKK
ncbi:MAG: MucB/RseB C-terminal domain-containing protein [Armatimonadota bacterium]